MVTVSLQTKKCFCSLLLIQKYMATKAAKRNNLFTTIKKCLLRKDCNCTVLGALKSSYCKSNTTILIEHLCCHMLNSTLHQWWITHVQPSPTMWDFLMNGADGNLQCILGCTGSVLQSNIWWSSLREAMLLLAIIRLLIFNLVPTAQWIHRCI